MKLGITGLSGSGRTTVFEALTRNISDGTNKSENRISTISVPDTRVDVLTQMYNPRKTIYAQVEYFLPGMASNQDKKKEQNIWTPIRDCDALIHVIRNFGGYGFEKQTPYHDFFSFDQELIFGDQVVVEKRLERLDMDKKRGKQIDPEEISLLNKALEYLENEIPLRKISEIAFSPLLRGYAFVSAKPMLVLFNNEDDDEALPEIPSEIKEKDFQENCMLIRAKLEYELGQMSQEEAREFLSEFHISASATDRVIQKSYDLLGLISFFTVGEDEVRAWTIKEHTPAVEAAGVIHSDIQKGFIRAEVVSYDDLMAAGNYAEARKKGTVRLEGKTYEVQDGDIINFRFNV
jgi:GTP-binding protein YchF